MESKLDKEDSKEGQWTKGLRRLESVEGMAEQTFWKDTFSSSLAKGNGDEKGLKSLWGLQPGGLASGYGIVGRCRVSQRRAGFQGIVLNSTLTELNLRGQGDIQVEMSLEGWNSEQ